jgi:hypothetical protein
MQDAPRTRATSADDRGSIKKLWQRSYAVNAGTAHVAALPFETLRFELDLLWPFGHDPDYA